MKTKRIFSLMGATLLALGPTVLAAGHGGGGGFGGGGHPGGGGFHAAPRAFGGGRPAYFYSRGMHFAQPSTGQFRSAGHMVPSSTIASLSLTMASGSGSIRDFSRGITTLTTPTITTRTTTIPAITPM